MGLQATATMLPKPFRKDWPKALEHDSYIGHGIDHMKLSVAAIVHIFFNTQIPVRNRNPSKKEVIGST